MLTISQQIYKKLKESNGWVASGELERWYLKNKDGTNPTPQTIGRKARKLVEAGYLESKKEGKRHHGHFRIRADNKEVVKNTLPPEPVIVMRDGNKIAVPPEAAPNLLANGWIRV